LAHVGVAKRKRSGFVKGELGCFFRMGHLEVVQYLICVMGVGRRTGASVSKKEGGNVVKL
jgi:hypothetical protein